MVAGIPTPTKIIALHLGYRSRAAERGRVPAHPSYFLKPVSSIGASGAAVRRPAGCELLAFEGEIALVIGKQARRVTPADGWAHVGWITAANDLGVYDLRYADRGSNLRSKGADGFTPLGPDVPRRPTTSTRARSSSPRGSTATLRSTQCIGDEQLFDFGYLVADLSRL